MDQEIPKVDPEALKAARADLSGQLKELGWGEFPLDRSTVQWEIDSWESFQDYAKAKYGQADEGLKKAIEKVFDTPGYRRFRAFRDLPASPVDLPASPDFFRLFPPTNSQAQDQTAAKVQALQSVECSCLWIAKEESCNNFLRFYSDRKVISVPSPSSPAEIACWFKKPYSLWGTYRITGSAIKFYLMDHNSTLEWEGTIQGSSMQLNEFCPEYNYRAEKRFELVAFGATDNTAAPNVKHSEAPPNPTAAKDKPTQLQLAVNHIEVATSFPAYLGGGSKIIFPDATRGELTSPANLLKITFSVTNTSQETASFQIGDVQLAIGPYIFDDFAAVGYDAKLCAVPYEYHRKCLKEDYVSVSPAATRVLSFAFPVPDSAFKRGELFLRKTKSVPFALPGAPGEQADGPDSASAVHRFVSKVAAWLRRKHPI
jgi:hypothetical protein